MSYEDEVETLRVELEREVASLTQALAKSREENDELVEENARLVAENEAVGRENSVLKEKLDESRGPY
jgi:regulator of replication initiation timing